MSTFTSLLCFLSLVVTVTPFTIPQSTSLLRPSFIIPHPPTSLKSSTPPSDEEEPTLLFGSSLDDLAPQNEVESPAEAMFLSQQHWGDVSKKRNEEAKIRLREEQEREEEEARLRLSKTELEEDDQSPNAENYGPGDLSNLGKGLLDEKAWEGSLGDDDSGLIILENDAEGDNLLILGDEGEDGEGGLIF
ncbi:hypothetical protein TrLO_g12322 [Triparma laevis f. longispina]|uniref:Uncharacterized protein n=1 Tax=Triparma laevis f. longispina TaxID=1714387 RepID=A0A9W7FLJ8_9STRA|nr:hypothetical protein TrLO_g12322 [Triparma laevis f. longispina]